MTNKTDSLHTTALRAWVTFLVIVSGSLLLLFLYTIKTIVLQLVVALILAVALKPITNYLMRHKFNRVGAAVMTVVITLFVMLGIFGAIASPLVTQGASLSKNGPALIDQATASPVLRRLDKQFHVVQQAKTLTKDAPQLLQAHGGSVFGVLGSVFSAVSAIAVILILLLFMLMEGPTAWSQFIRLLGRKQGKFVDQIAEKIVVAVGGFVNGNLFISLIAGIVSLLTLLVTGVPYAFALAALVAVFDLIPLVGAALATLIVGLVALSQGVVVALIVVAVLLSYQFVEGNIIQPVVYGKAVKLSQLLIVVSTLVGGVLGGIIGVLLAIPIAATLQIIVVEVLRANGANLEPEVDASVQD